jgi:hypothetical protein
MIVQINEKIKFGQAAGLPLLSPDLSTTSKSSLDLGLLASQAACFLTCAMAGMK